MTDNNQNTPEQKARDYLSQTADLQVAEHPEITHRTLALFTLIDDRYARYRDLEDERKAEGKKDVQATYRNFKAVAKDIRANARRMGVTTEDAETLMAICNDLKEKAKAERFRNMFDLLSAELANNNYLRLAAAERICEWLIKQIKKDSENI